MLGDLVGHLVLGAGGRRSIEELLSDLSCFIINDLEIIIRGLIFKNIYLNENASLSCCISAYGFNFLGENNISAHALCTDRWLDGRDRGIEGD